MDCGLFTLCYFMFVRNFKFKKKNKKMFSYLLTFIVTLIIVGIGIRIVFLLLDKLPEGSGYDLTALIIMFFSISLLVTLVKPDFFKIHTGPDGGMYQEIDMIAV